MTLDNDLIHEIKHEGLEIKLFIYYIKNMICCNIFFYELDQKRNNTHS